MNRKGVKEMKETNEMLEILHSNCKRQRILRMKKRQAYIDEQEKGNRWCKILSITLVASLIFELTILVIERMN